MSVESTGTTFGGKTILRPEPVAAALAALGKKANHYTCPVGPEPASGSIVMRRADVDALDLNAAQTLIFKGTSISTGGQLAGPLRTFTLYGLRVAADPIRLLSVGDENPNAPYLVELTDIRHLAKEFSSINKSYNLRKPAPPMTAGKDRYYSASLNAGALWTWATLVSDLWTNFLSVLGSAPSLPYTPTGTPEDFRFVGCSAWQALHQVLKEIGCTTALNPTVEAGGFALVQLGSTQTNLVAREASYAGRVLGNTEALLTTATKVPETIRVFFTKRDDAGRAVRGQPSGQWRGKAWVMLPSRKAKPDHG